MKYEKTCIGTFISRPNRFIAYVDIDGEQIVCHVKNTGRCKELLMPGVKVILEISSNPNRKTAYDLIAVYKKDRLINIDSQAPNKVANEYLHLLFPNADEIKPECKYGNSRIDFRITEKDQISYLEVKGVTLEQDNIVSFPDAPTERGTKHLKELQKAKKEGYGAYVLFVIQMSDVLEFRPNDNNDPEFGKELRSAKKSGVEILTVSCNVTENSLDADSPVPITL